MSVLAAMFIGMSLQWMGQKPELGPRWIESGWVSVQFVGRTRDWSLRYLPAAPLWRLQGPGLAAFEDARLEYLLRTMLRSELAAVQVGESVDFAFSRTERGREEFEVKDGPIAGGVRWSLCIEEDRRGDELWYRARVPERAIPWKAAPADPEFVQAPVPELVARTAEDLKEKATWELARIGSLYFVERER